MSREYRKREEENELIKRFEDHLRKKKTEFFDLDAYEEIIDFYMLRSKHNKALQAVNQAIHQYPFSIELITIKAQVLTNLEEYDQALELLDQSVGEVIRGVGLGDWAGQDLLQRAGDVVRARGWIEVAKHQQPAVTRDRFFRSFPFAADDVRARLASLLSQSGL